MFITMPIITRPDTNECSEYFLGYVKQVAEEDAFVALEKAATTTPAFLASLPPNIWDYRYAPGKWSAKEALLHMLDTERIFAYRALRIARNDATPLPGFEQDEYILYMNAESRSPASIMAEYRIVRAGTLELFRHFTPEALQRRGTASNNPISVRALAFLIAGHEQHHLRILRERYMGNIAGKK